jgi:hypothetical protein
VPSEEIVHTLEDFGSRLMKDEAALYHRRKFIGFEDVRLSSIQSARCAFSFL